MEYRKIGNTGMSASIIGLGAEHLDNKPYEVVRDTVHAAMEHGMNIMDLFMPGDEVRKNIGRALSGNRDKFIIQGHIGSTDLKQQYDISRDLPTCQKYFERLLKCLNTDYIDVGMLFFIDSDNDFDRVFNSDILSYAQRLKRQGIIRAIGASSHNPISAKKVVATGEVDLIMFSINPAFDMIPANASTLDELEQNFSEKNIYNGIRPDRLELYQLCEQRNVAVTVMKTLGAGKLLSTEHTPFGQPLTAIQCIHYALTRPAVVSALIGCKSPGEVESAMKYFVADENALDYTPFIGSLRDDFSGRCVYCGHCQPCPADIDIVSVNKYLDIARLNEKNIPPSVVSHYKSLGNHKCLECGHCETRCPFGVRIIDNIKLAEKLLNTFPRYRAKE